MKGEINLYDVLGVNKTASRQEIKIAYAKLVQIYHPDKGGDPELFQLITDAYNTLVDPQRRSEYDESSKVSKQSSSDHSSLKKAADDFFKNLNMIDITEEEYNKQKNDAHNNFIKESQNMDRKHNFNKDDVGKTIDRDEANRRMRDLEMTREQEDIELTQDKLFENDRTFDLAKFNAMFDVMHKRNDELVPHTGNPSAFNDATDMSFGSYNNYDTLYDEGEYTGDNTNASIHLNNVKSSKKINKHDMKHIASADYVKNHNKKDANYNRALEDLVKERENEDHKLNERTFKDFDTDPSMGGYGIFHDAGITGNELDWMDDMKNMQNKYDRLLELRKNPKNK